MKISQGKITKFKINMIGETSSINFGEPFEINELNTTIKSMKYKKEISNCDRKALYYFLSQNHITYLQ